MSSEFIDFLRFESRYGLRVLANDILAVAAVHRQEEYLDDLLEFAKEHSLSFTFFVSSKNIEKRQKIISRMVSDGHELASHGHRHLLLGEKDRAAIEHEIDMSNEIFNRCGLAPLGFRPPFLSVSKGLLEILREHGFSYVSCGEDFSACQEGITNIPVLRPYDWEATVAENMPFEEASRHWKDAIDEGLCDGKALLFHPWMMRERKQMQLLLELSAGKDMRICRWKRKGRWKIKGHAITFDVY